MGELLFPKINQIVSKENANHVPKITGMLIDFTVFELSDILELFEDN